MSEYSFSANISGVTFTASGNNLVIKAKDPSSQNIKVTAERKNSKRRGVVVWTDVTTGSNGEIQIDDLVPGIYTVTEQAIDKYESQESKRITVIGVKVTTVTFHNTLKKGDLKVTKTSEDGLTEGMKFHLSGISLSGLEVDEYAMTDSSGIALFEDIPVSGNTPYLLEEVETGDRYVVPKGQKAVVEWDKVTEKSFRNVLKKWRVTVTKSDKENGEAQGNASLAGAKYGIYKGGQLIDTYDTDENGQFTTG